MVGGGLGRGGLASPCFFASYTAANGRPCRYSLPPAAAAPAPARKEAGN